MDRILIALLCGSLYNGSPDVRNSCIQGFTAASIQSGFHQDSDQLQAAAEQKARHYANPRLMPLLILAGAFATKSEAFSVGVQSEPFQYPRFMFGQWTGQETKALIKSRPEFGLKPFAVADSVQVESDLQTTELVFTWAF